MIPACIVLSVALAAEEPAPVSAPVQTAPGTTVAVQPVQSSAHREPFFLVADICTTVEGKASTVGVFLGVDVAPFGRTHRPLDYDLDELHRRLSLFGGIQVGEWTGKGFDAPTWAAGIGIEVAPWLSVRVGGALRDRPGEGTDIVPYISIGL